MNRWIDLMIYGSEEYKRRQSEMVKQYPEGSFTDLKDYTDMKAAGVWVDYDYENVPYVEGALNRGFDEQTLLKIKEQWIKFGEYCFNKSHSVCYAFLSVITAWLKLYYPTEFMAALLTISEGKKDKNDVPKNVAYMSEAESMGIRILPPDVNLSMSGWTPKRYLEPITENNETYIGEIRYGLSSIAKISGESVNEIINNRPYSSVDDLLNKVNNKKINKTKVEALIKSGAFDSINKNRNLLLRHYYQSRGEDYSQIPKTTNKSAILAYERDYLGTSVSVRSRWEKVEDGAATQVTGYIRSIEKWRAKSSGKEHFTLVVDTNEEPIQVTVWGYIMNRYQNALQLGNKVTIKGEKSRDKLTAKSVQDTQQFEVDFSDAVGMN